MGQRDRVIHCAGRAEVVDQIGTIRLEPCSATVLTVRHGALTATANRQTGHSAPHSLKGVQSDFPLAR